MPKAAKVALIWSQEAQAYILHRDDRAPQRLPSDDDTVWRAWLATATAFSFQGQQGRANLLKEQRKGSTDGYWYAYQRQGQRVRKHYAGRTADLFPTKLEDVVSTLNAFAADGSGSPKAAVDQQLALGNKARDVDENRAVELAAVTDPSLPLLFPKLQAPRLQDDLIARPRLLRQLDGALTRRLTLVAAPAGFGKTTVVRQWLATRHAQPTAPAVAWLALDTADNDPVRFWRYLIAAYQSIDHDWGAAAMAQLTLTPPLPIEPLPLDVIVTTLLNSLSRITQTTLLILDDYHLISAASIHSTLTFFLEHLPATMHLLLLTRSEPPLPLARWRMRNELLELRAADLHFSTLETQHFLQQVLTLPALATTDQAAARQVVAQLETQLEGWPAGWRLLALALDRAQDLAAVKQFVTTFAGSHRPLLAYFADEVLSTLPLTWQQFLLQISGLERFTASLCAAITGNAQSGELLEQLTQAGLFLEALEGEAGWYRLHPLFAEAMQHEAQQRLGEDALRQVAAQASHWYTAHALPAEAIETALRAADYERAATLIQALNRDSFLTSKLQPFGMPNEFHTLLRWLTQLPQEQVQQEPTLSLEYATALLMVHFSEHYPMQVSTAFDTALSAAERGFRAAGNTAKLAEVFAFRALLARQQGTINQAALWAQQALVWLPESALAWRSVSLSASAIDAYFADSLDRAYEQMQRALALVQTVGNPYFVRSTAGQLSAICLERGALHETVRLLQPLLAEARQVGDIDDIGHAQLGLANVAYRWNQLADAQAAGTEAHQAIQLTDNEAHPAEATLLLAQIAFAQGNRQAAAAQLTTLVAELPRQQSQRHNELYHAARCLQARFALRMGDLAAVERWVRSRENTPTAHLLLYAQHEELLVARWQLAQGEVTTAITTLQNLLRQAEQFQRRERMLEIQLVLALAYQAHQATAEALVTLQTVVAVTALQGHLRLFLDEDQDSTLVPLLRALYPTLTDQTQRGHVRQLVQAFAAADPNAALAPALDLLEPLSAQEQRVLHALATGSNNNTIAQELIVSVNTIRSQLQSIYRKLDVNNRVAAVETARRLGLLS